MPCKLQRSLPPWRKAKRPALAVFRCTNVPTPIWCLLHFFSAGSLFKLDGWKWIEANAVAGTLHLIGLLSDGGVHSRLVGTEQLAWRSLGLLLETGNQQAGVCQSWLRPFTAASPAPGLPRTGRYDQLTLLMEGAIQQGVKRIRLHVLSGTVKRVALGGAGPE